MQSLRTMLGEGNVVYLLILLLAFAAAQNNNGKDTRYVAKLGRYGRFQLKVQNRGTMKFQVKLKKIDDLADRLDMELEELNYQLSTRWESNDEFEVGSDDCGRDVTGGHFDPYFACGPYSMQPERHCNAIDKPFRDYDCEGAYEDEEFSKCAVGDLSGKYGALDVNNNGRADFTVQRDPLPAETWQYKRNNGNDDPAVFSSIVFRNKFNRRVLCGRLVVAN